MKQQITLRKAFIFSLCLFAATVLLLIKKMMLYNGF